MGEADFSPVRDVEPSLPTTNPCLSYWQRTTRAFPHLNANRETCTCSKRAPTLRLLSYVIIGSGISGALTAFELIENGIKGEYIVILEAREAASGASSRNAGHVRPDAFRGFKHYSSLHGPEQALKILDNERVVLNRVDEFVKKHHVDCDFNLKTTFDVCMTPGFAAYEAANFDAVRKAGGDLSHVKFYNGDEAREKTGIKDAITAYEWPAGSSHPAKLAQWLLNAVINSGCRLFTHCPVTKITPSCETNSSLWDAATPRGTIATSTVIHCTNAYVSLLLPQLKPHLTPNRAQAHSLIAPSGFSGEKVLGSTYSLRYSLQHFYSLIQRHGDGTLILGVSRTNPNLSAETRLGCITFDESSYNEEILDDAFAQWDKIFPGDNKTMSSGKAHGEGLDHAWTGIIGMTGDSVPFVGQVEGLKGQYVCAGFGGHGMAWIFTCAPGVAKLVLGEEWSATGLPECFQMSEERLQRITNGK